MSTDNIPTQVTTLPAVESLPEPSEEDAAGNDDGEAWGNPEVSELDDGPDDSSETDPAED